jgi:hypothetical protein
MITDEFPCESVDNDYRGLLGAYQMDNMEYPPDPEEDICEHGMSAWLCAHPIYHYPTDEMMNEGRYY